MNSLLKRLEFVAVLYYRKGEDDDALDEAMSGLVAIKEEAMLNDIYFVLVSDQGSDSITRSLWSHHKVVTSRWHNLLL